MSDYNEKLDELQKRFEKMAEYQGYFNREVEYIRNEINRLQSSQASGATPVATFPENDPVIERPVAEVKAVPFGNPKPVREPKFSFEKAAEPQPSFKYEDFIGRNLISIIGILITILGVGIGTKYAIDNNLISPALRIIIGYIFGLGLLGFASFLKAKYEKFSAVLLSGSVAILYFVTYFAYSFYGMIPQTAAFVMMVAVTVFTVVAAWVYNRQVIGVIGLVGAYAVPFLVSNNTGNVRFLLTYMVIINSGMVAVSVRKYWRVMSCTAFALTWMIYFAWLADRYDGNYDFGLAFVFGSLFFAVFYAAFAIKRLLHNESLTGVSLVMICANALVYFVVGIALLDTAPQMSQYFGFFTLANAVVHVGVAHLITQIKDDKTAIQILAALAVFFITLAVPLKMQGIWVPVFWTIEAVYLYWVFAAKRIGFFAVASYILAPLSVMSLFTFLAQNSANWEVYGSTTKDSIVLLTPFLNEAFLASFVFCIGFAVILYLMRRYSNPDVEMSDFERIFQFAVSTSFLVAFYNLFRAELGNYWHGEYVKSGVLSLDNTGFERGRLVFDRDLSIFNALWQLNYTMLFLSAVAVVNIKWLKNPLLGFSTLAFNGLVLAIFAVGGLFFISELRDSYLDAAASQFFRGTGHISIRYISLGFAALLLAATYWLYRQEFVKRVADVMAIFDTVFATIILIALSSELLNLTDLAGQEGSFKLALSILWGIYSLILIVIGIAYAKTHLRIGAMVLFAVTLVKLFLYDLSSLTTVAKTVVFVSLGLILLVISFLYNKYKSAIFPAEKEN